MTNPLGDVHGTLEAGMPLSPLLEGVDVQSELTADVAETPITAVVFDSRKVVPGALFVCVRGFETDGHRYAAQVVSRGAAVLVVDHLLDVDLPQIVVPDTRIALGVIARNFYGDPSGSLDIVGITGTNGKTTTTYILDAILRAAGRRTGVIGTVEVRIGDVRVPSKRTTPESAELQELLADMAAAEVSAVSMEVSSHAIDLHRVGGVSFAVVAFTNLTQDHLDYHHTLEAYRDVKKRLFTDFPARARVIDIDTPIGEALAAEIARSFPVLASGRSARADIRAEDEVSGPTGTVFTLHTPEGAREVRFPLAGGYNVSNALIAAGSAIALGIDLDDVVVGLESAPQVPGRLERIECGQQFSVVVDYAHTPDSLDKALHALRQVTPGALRVVFGCGGDRDPSKRSLMGKVAGELADFTIVTSDNPRSEDPISIVHEVEDGVRGAGGNYEIEVDRGAAIARAIAVAKSGDCVLIAGKGHEDYQIFAEYTAHFDDREVAREALRSLGYTGGTTAC